MKKRKGVAVVLVILFMLSFMATGYGTTAAASSTMYYVDLDNGNDANDGLTQTTAWKNIPGTKNVSNTGWVSGNTGWMALNPGDTIRIKSGTTHSSTDGGRILIDSTYYANGTADAPITIIRDTTWGIGQILIDGNGITTPLYDGLFEIRRNYIIVDGAVDDGIKLQGSSHNGFIVYGTGDSGCALKNLEAYNCFNADILVCSSSYPTYYIQNVKLDNITAHLTSGVDDWNSCIMLQYCDNAIVTNAAAYDAGSGSDGIHLGSCKNTWIRNCTVYNNGEQGVDISRDGDYKSRDDSYNNTVIDCTGYENFKMNFDCNSASRDIYFINCVGWKTTETEVGDGNFMAYEGGNRVFFINCTSAASHDFGYGFAWWGQYYNLLRGTYNQYMINSISSGDSGRSLDVENSLKSRSYAIYSCHSDFNSTDANNYAVKDKLTYYTKDNINNSTGGWSQDHCIAVDPLFVATGSTWATNDLRLQANSPASQAGEFPLTTSASGSGTVITLNKLVSDIDATRVFYPGDTIQIEGSGTYTVASVNSSNQVTLTSSATWSAGKGIWFPWSGNKPNMGALSTVP